VVATGGDGPGENEQVTTRRATRDDLPALYEIHRAALGPYVKRTWGWDEDRQSREFLARKVGPGMRVIEEGGAVVGFIEVEEQTDRLVLRTIEIAPEYQRRGIGTKLIRELLARSWSTGRPVHLRVLRCNPARGLYERLGFRAVRETETHVLMRTPTSG
jgi:ribosomal protein S18 acetylase RimI-like enzyme